MGYRSDVAYIIKFNDIETRDNFVTLMLAKNNPQTTQALSECEYGYSDDPIITFEAFSVKWYNSFEDVKAHERLMLDAVEIFKHKGGRYRYVGVGEDGAEDFREDDDEGDLYEYISTVHEIQTSFPNIRAGFSTLTTNEQE
jgi:hypothetical protein